MKLLILVFIIALLASCHSKNRKEILGRDFSNSEIQSIEIVEIAQPMLGGILETKQLTAHQMSDFLNEFDNLKQKGMYKCATKHIIRLNFEQDTLRLKYCNGMFANREKDMYYGFR